MERSVLLTASLVLGLALMIAVILEPEGRRALVAGLTDPLRGLDHFLALLALGIWVGRLQDPNLWALPAAFLVGMASGFLLMVGQPPIPLADVLVHVVLLGSLLSFVAAILLPIRLPTREAISTVAMVGGCHGYLHGHEVGWGAALWFGLGFLVAAALLLAVGVLVGLTSPPVE